MNKEYPGGWLAVAGTVHHYQEKAHNLRLLLWERRRGVGVGVQHFHFSEGSSWNWHLYLLTLGADGEPADFGCLVAAENKEEQNNLLLSNQGIYSAIGRHQREQEIKRSWKRNERTSLNEKLKAQTQENIITQKKFSEAPESLAGLIGEGLPFYEASS